jgi:hypothetical protein
MNGNTLIIFGVMTIGTACGTIRRGDAATLLIFVLLLFQPQVGFLHDWAVVALTTLNVFAVVVGYKLGDEITRHHPPHAPYGYYNPRWHHRLFHWGA